MVGIISWMKFVVAKVDGFGFGIFFYASIWYNYCNKPNVYGLEWMKKGQ